MYEGIHQSIYIYIYIYMLHKYVFKAFNGTLMQFGAIRGISSQHRVPASLVNSGHRL